MSTAASTFQHIWNLISKLKHPPPCKFDRSQHSSLNMFKLNVFPSITINKVQAKIRAIHIMFHVQETKRWQHVSNGSGAYLVYKSQPHPPTHPHTHHPHNHSQSIPDLFVSHTAILNGLELLCDVFSNLLPNITCMDTIATIYSSQFLQYDVKFELGFIIRVTISNSETYLQAVTHIYCNLVAIRIQIPFYISWSDCFQSHFPWAKWFLILRRGNGFTHMYCIYEWLVTFLKILFASILLVPDLCEASEKLLFALTMKLSNFECAYITKIKMACQHCILVY